MGEQEQKISLLQRLIEHALNTARYNIYYGEAATPTIARTHGA